MNISRITVLLVLGSVLAMPAAEVDTNSASLERAKEIGRVKSRFLKENSSPGIEMDAVPKPDLARFRNSIAPVLNNSCIACHGPERTEGRLRVDQLDPDLLSGADVEKWREIYNAVGNSEMPPEDESNIALADANRRDIVDWLSNELNKASVARRHQTKHSSFRRLAKYEYNYALQDLLGLPYPLSDRLPPETASEDGFKNSSELLQMSAMQFDLYRDIGLAALKRATVRGARPPVVTYTISMQQEMDKAAGFQKAKVFNRNDRNYNRNRNRLHLLNQVTGKAIHISGGKPSPESKAAAGALPDESPVVLVMPRSSELKLNLDRFLPDDGIMRVTIRAGRTTMKANEYASLRLIFSAHTSNNANFSEVISRADVPVTSSAEKPQLIHFDIALSDIQRNPFRKLTTTFPRRDEFLHIRNISNATGGEDPLHVLIDHIEISAPFYEQWPPKTHTNIFVESENRNDEQAYGREVLNRFLRRVWRRPVAPDEVEPFMRLFTEYRPGFSNFEDAMLQVLATALATPEFLYLTRRNPVEDAGVANQISDVELASRLSFFLWSSIPDDELLRLAEQGELKKPEVLAEQVERMLTDHRADRFAQNFVQQWLGLDGLDNATHVTDESLNDAMMQEPVAFFQDVLNNNASIMDFIHSDYAVVNERLARHYGIPAVHSPHFRKVSIARETNRGGMLTAAGLLAMNSDDKDSNPLKRGVWMLERILDDPPPPPPPNVPEVDLTDPRILQMTLKERIADHRNKPACASCHSKIDPWGIAFENFDALGAYRTRINDQPVDATSELFNKQKLAGIDGLKRYLFLERQDQFARAMVRKMTAYALGRPLSFGDHASIESLTAQFRRRGDRLGDLVTLIIGSELFCTD